MYDPRAIPSVLYSLSGEAPGWARGTTMEPSWRKARACMARPLEYPVARKLLRELVAPIRRDCGLRPVNWVAPTQNS